MPNEDLSRSIRDLQQRLDENDEAYVQRLADWEDWRKEIARIAERLTTIVVGDPAINHKGLVERVQGHEAFISEAKDKAAETKGSRKTWFFICGIVGAILAKFIDMGFQILAAHVGK